jgi:hypothetical protein
MIEFGKNDRVFNLCIAWYRERGLITTCSICGGRIFSQGGVEIMESVDDESLPVRGYICEDCLHATREVSVLRIRERALATRCRTLNLEAFGAYYDAITVQTLEIARDEHSRHIELASEDELEEDVLVQAGVSWRVLMSQTVDTPNDTKDKKSLRADSDSIFDDDLLM